MKFSDVSIGIFDLSLSKNYFQVALFMISIRYNDNLLFESSLFWFYVDKRYIYLDMLFNKIINYKR